MALESNHLLRQNTSNTVTDQKIWADVAFPNDNHGENDALFACTSDCSISHNIFDLLALRATSALSLPLTVFTYSHIPEVSSVTLSWVYMSHIFICLSLFSRLHPCSTEESGIFPRTAEESGASKGESLDGFPTVFICCHYTDKTTVTAVLIKHFVTLVKWLVDGSPSDRDHWSTVSATVT